MPTINIDIAIIGSGAGGGTVAATLAPLAKAGKKIVVFEKGPRFINKHFNGNELEMAGKLYAEGGAVANKDHTITYAFSEGYGGSTIVYTGTSLLPPERIINKWNLPGINHDDLCKRAEKFKKANSVGFTPKDKLNDNNLLFAKGCEALGWKADRFPVNVKNCKGSSLCNLGCPNGAKQGTNRVQLPEAEAAGVEVVTLAEVHKIGEKSLELTISEHAKGYSSEWDAGEYLVNAEQIIVCAGAVHSPALLLRSGFGEDLPALGRYWTCHPAHILIAEHEKPITNSVGHPKSFVWEERIEQDHFFLESCMYFPFTTAKNMTGFGYSHQTLMEAYERLQMILVLACDEARWDQHISIDSEGQPIINYELTPKTIEAMVKATKAAAKIFFAAGAKKVHAPSARPPLLNRADLDKLDKLIQIKNFMPGSISVTAAHLMGGCRMGVSTRNSVTNPDGQVHGKPWLHVADASLFPTALEINPYLTIMALADRVAENVAKNLKAKELVT